MYSAYFIIKCLEKGECGYQKCVYSKDDVVCSHQVFARVVSSFICAVGLLGACLSKWTTLTLITDILAKIKWNVEYLFRRWGYIVVIMTGNYWITEKSQHIIT